MGFRVGCRCTVEARDQDRAAASAAELLDSTPGGQPQRIEGRTEDEIVDRETGEITGGQPDEQAGNGPGFDQMEERDAAGFSIHPAEAVADRILQQARAANTIIDLEALYQRAYGEIEDMPEEIAALVEAGFQEGRNRLTPRKAKVEA